MKHNIRRARTEIFSGCDFRDGLVIRPQIKHSSFLSGPKSGGRMISWVHSKRYTFIYPVFHSDVRIFSLRRELCIVELSSSTIEFLLYLLFDYLSNTLPSCSLRDDSYPPFFLLQANEFFWQHCVEAEALLTFERQIHSIRKLSRRCRRQSNMMCFCRRSPLHRPQCSCHTDCWVRIEDIASPMTCTSFVKVLDCLNGLLITNSFTFEVFLSCLQYLFINTKSTFTL